MEDYLNLHLFLFRAYLTAFDDSYNASWNSFKYIGRAEDFYTYGGFSRSIQVGFQVAASSRGELTPLYSKLNALAGSTAPTYIGNSFYERKFSSINCRRLFN